MKTETKVMLGIGIFTILIIIAGVLFFKRNVSTGPADYSKNITEGLSLDNEKVSRDYNPKITGISSDLSTSTQATSSTIYVTEFLDYLCPACATSGETITKNLLAKYGSNIIITRKIYPIHGQQSVDIARLVLASQIFGNEAYERVHKEIFLLQDSWIRLPKKDRDAFIEKLITDLGLNYEELYKESQDQKYTVQINQDRQDANDLGIRATPSFIVGNHTIITGGLPMEEIYKYIDMK